MHNIAQKGSMAEREYGYVVYFTLTVWEDWGPKSKRPPLKPRLVGRPVR